MNTAVTPAEKAAILAHYTEQAAAIRKPAHPAMVARWLESLPADAVMAEAQALARELALLKGHGHTPQAGCTHHTVTMGDAEVLVEVEHEAASGDGWNEPRCAASAAVIGVFINGAWCDPQDFVSAKIIEGWEERIATEMQEAADDDRVESYEANREWA